MNTKQFFLTMIALITIIGLSSASYFWIENNKQDRDKEAYKNSIKSIESYFKAHTIELSKVNILFISFKKERMLNLYVGNENQSMILYKSYPICAMSGELGPKLQSGDEQTPEGFYRIDRFNPKSRFHLSLGINYPNKSDKIRSQTMVPGKALGGDIFIHGSCVSIGCMAMTDNSIEEIYTLAQLAKNAGQKNIPVYILPMNFELKSNLNYESDKENSQYQAYFPLWKSLKEGFDSFQKNKKPLSISITKTGNYNIQ